MKRVNRDGQLPLPSILPMQLGLADLDAALRKKATVIDARPARNFAAGHVPGSMNIPLGKSFLNWAGALVPEETDFYLITDLESDEAIKAVVCDLAKIGLTGVAGLFGADILSAWKSHHGQPEEVPQLDPRGLHDILAKKKVQVVDVRAPDEWRSGHLPGAIHIPLAALPDRVGELDASVPVVLHCKGGGRSSIATSLLQAKGFANVSNLAGGYDGWVAEGFEVKK